MKKYLAVVVMLSAVLLIVPTSLAAYQHMSDYDGVRTPNMGCHRSTEDEDFEWYYTHLSQEDQRLIDAKFISLLDDTNFNELSEDEKQTTLDHIKAQLIRDILEMDLPINSTQ